MTIDKIHKKVDRLRVVSDAKMKYPMDHAKLLDQEFEELKEISESELDIIYD